MKVKNLFAGIGAAVLAVVVMVNATVVTATINDPEFDAALAWMYDNGLTKYNTQDAFMPYANLTREQFAKFAGAYGVRDLCLEADVNASCSFSDIPADPTLDEWVMLACQLGLVKGSQGKYFPTAAVLKSEVLTVMSRAISAADGETAPSEDMTPRWKGHFDAMRAIGVTKETDPYAVDRPVTRYEVALMLYRSRVNDSECKDVDLSDLLDDLFGDDDDDMDEDATSDATVSSKLSAQTPNGTKVPGNVSVHVATFEFTAVGDDAVLNSLVLKRMGLGNKDVLDSATIFVNNAPVTKSRTFNSDNIANFSLNPKVTIPAGQTVRVDVIVKVGDASVAAGQEFAIALEDFDTNGTDNTNNLPVQANKFEVAAINAARVEVTHDGSISDVELGAQDAEVAKFEIDNKSNNRVFITQITLEDDERNADENLANFFLTHNGVTLATTANAVGRTVTFVLNNPFMIDGNETEDFRVFADVVAGAGESIGFFLDEEIYVRGYDDIFGYGLDVDALWTVPQTFAINAGQVTFVEKKLVPNKIRADRQDIELARFDININAGQDLSLEDIMFRAEDVGGFGGDDDLMDYFEDFQLVVWINGSRSTYDVNVSKTCGPTDCFTAGDDDLGIFLDDSADITIALIADAVNTFDSNVINEQFRITLDVVNDVRIIENSDEEEVEDIVPSSISFDTLTFVETAIEVNSIILSDVSVVIGAQNVDAVLFEVVTDDVSSALVDGFTFAGTTNTGTAMGQQLLTAVRLWKKVDSGWELLEQRSGFQVQGGQVTFSNFADVIIPASSEQLFLMTVDIIDSDNVAGTEFFFELISSDIEDDDNTQLCNPASSCNADSTRDITVEGMGALDVSVDNNESEVQDPQFVLGGKSAAQSPFVASFELIADNEAIFIERLAIIATGAGVALFDDAVMEVIIYGDDMTTVLGSRTVSSSTVTFNSFNREFPEGVTNLWVKVVADLIGSQYEGTATDDISLMLQLIDVEGVDSGDDITPNYDGVGRTLESNPFQVVAAKFADANFVLSAAGVTVDTTVTNGNDINIAILQLTADSWSNTQESPVGSLKMYVDVLTFFSSNLTDVDNFEIRRIGNGSTSYVPGTVDLTGGTVTFVLSGENIATREFVSAEVGYYQVRADIDATGNTSIKLTLDNLNGGSPEPIEYDMSDNSATYTALRIGDDLVESPNVSVNNG